MAKLKIEKSGTGNEYNRILLYAETGMGKTPLAATAPGVAFVDAEKGMKSAPGIPRIRVKTFKEAKKAVKMLEADKRVQTIVVDSGSFIAKKYLKQISPDYKNKVQAYGDLYETMISWIEDLQEVEKHLVFICRQKFFEVDGSEKYRPQFPGKALTPEVPYEFESVFALRLIDDSGEDSTDGEGTKVIQTSPDEEYTAKDRSCNLKQFETTLDFTKLFKKMEGKKHGKG